MVVSSWESHYGRASNQAEQQLYDHLLQLVQSESPSQLIERFRSLFIEGTSYPDREIVTSLNQIIDRQNANEEFHFILNRCCYILINRWQSRPQLQVAIPELLHLFDLDESPAKPVFSRARSMRRLRPLIQTFVQTDQYFTLRRLAQVLHQPTDEPGNIQLGGLIHRYPYLYEHCLLTDRSTQDQKQAIRRLQSEAQHRYEIDLASYITHQVKRAQLVKTTSLQTAARISPPVKNPTLLSDTDLGYALKQFIGKSQNRSTYRDVAQRFLSHAQHSRSYGEFKDELYEYLLPAIDVSYGQRQFNRQLHHVLTRTLQDSDDQPLNDFLVIRTCSQLLNFLVVESVKKRDHFVFVDLITNLGPLSTTGLLLKIVLICRKIKPYLERQVAILFNHYETHTQDAVLWLVEMMENLNVALCTNFSKGDLSVINQWL